MSDARNAIEVVVGKSLAERSRIEKQLDKLIASSFASQEIFKLIAANSSVKEKEYYQLYELGDVIFKAAVITSVSHSKPFYAGTIRVEYI